MGCFQCWRGLAGGLCTVDRGWHRALVFGGNRRAYRFAKSCPNFQGVQGLKWGAVVSLGWFGVEALRMALVLSGGGVLSNR